MACARLLDTCSRDITKSRGACHLPKISGWDVNGTPVFLLETFQWKCMFHLRVFKRNHQFQAIHSDVCVTILNFGDESMKEWNLCLMEHVLHSMDLSMKVSQIFW